MIGYGWITRIPLGNPHMHRVVWSFLPPNDDHEPTVYIDSWQWMNITKMPLMIMLFQNHEPPPLSNLVKPRKNQSQYPSPGYWVILLTPRLPRPCIIYLSDHIPRPCLVFHPQFCCWNAPLFPWWSVWIPKKLLLFFYDTHIIQGYSANEHGIIAQFSVWLGFLSGDPCISLVYHSYHCNYP